jgi:hypothetical protein
MTNIPPEYQNFADTLPDEFKSVIDVALAISWCAVQIAEATMARPKPNPEDL